MASDNIKNIDYLITLISNQIQKNKVGLQEDLDKTRTITYWNIGKLIHKHLQYYSDSPDYCKSLFTTLSKNFSISSRSLYLSLQFYKTYNKFDAISDRLYWGHFKILLTVKSEEERLSYEKMIFEKKLSIRDFSALVRLNKNNNIASPGNKLTLSPAVPYSYRIILKNNIPFIDLGFHTYSDDYTKRLEKYNVSDIIRVSKYNNRYRFYKADYDRSSIYTYKAFIVDVIDGDSLHVEVDLGFHIRVNQILRLRDIDAYDISTDTGKKGRDFILERFKGLTFIVIKTYRKDKYSRYLADVFYKQDESEILPVIKNGNFLNQELLDNKLAVKYYIY